MLTKLGTPLEETYVKIYCGGKWLGRPYGAMRRGRAAAFLAEITRVLGLKTRHRQLELPNVKKNNVLVFNINNLTTTGSVNNNS